MEPQEKTRTSEEAQKHADAAEYDSLIRSIEHSKYSPEEKDADRALLTAGYLNLNGDPLPEKVKKLARVDWEQIKRTLRDSEKINRILAAVEKPTAPAEPQGKVARVFAFVERCRREVAAIVIAFVFAPHGPEIVDRIARAFGK